MVADCLAHAGLDTNSTQYTAIKDIVYQQQWVKRTFPLPTHVLVDEAGAYCAFTSDPYDDDPASCPVTICSLYVKEAARGTGVGRRMIEKLHRGMAQQNRRIFATTAKRSTCGFWEKMGYVRGGTVDRDGFIPYVCELRTSALEFSMHARLGFSAVDFRGPPPTLPSSETDTESSCSDGDSSDGIDKDVDGALNLRGSGQVW